VEPGGRRRVLRSEEGHGRAAGGEDAPPPGGQPRGAPLRVLVADDDAVARAGLRAVLEHADGIEVAAEASSARTALFETRSARPDVVLLDLALRDGGGVRLVPALLHERPECKVVLLAADADAPALKAALAAGAHGFARRDADEAVDAVRSVAAGRRHVSPELAARYFAAQAEAARRAEEAPLSAREQQVLRLLALGYTNPEIAEQLHISVRTAESHRAHIMRKLSLASRADLVRYALDQGLLTP